MTGELAAEHPSEQRACEEQPVTGPCVVLGLLLAGRWANEVAAGLGTALKDRHDIPDIGLEDPHQIERFGLHRRTERRSHRRRQPMPAQVGYRVACQA